MFNPCSRYILGLSFFVFFCHEGSTDKVLQNDVAKTFEIQEPRIINGTLANVNATRHQVSIRKKRDDKFYFGSGHVCGGSLISENVVLSAAHCFINYAIENPKGTFYPDDYFYVTMGDLNRYNRTNNTLIFDIVKVVKRVQTFNLKRFQNDIVLVMLAGKVPANHPTVRPIILNSDPLANNTLCQVTGWGLTEEGYNSAILLTLDVPIIDFDDCREKTPYQDLITEGMLCAGYLEGGKDSCTGDSGGPLVCGGVQAGIISWGSNCAAPLLPGVLTNISFYKDWILKEVANHNGTLPKFAGMVINTNTFFNRDGGGDNTQGDGVASLTCSLMLISLMFILSFSLFQMK